MDATYTGGQGMPAPTAEDYRQYDRIWQRVAPNLNPYPQVRQESGGGDGDAGGGAGTGEDLEHLPGAQADPCCMGSAAMDSLQVVAGFIEDERAGRQFLLDFASRVSQPWIARPLRQMAEEKAAHLRHLTAAYYLTTGSRYAHTFQVPASSRGDTCCQALRSAYHEAAMLFMILSLKMLLVYPGLIYSKWMVVENMQKILLVSAVGGALTNVILNYFWIRLWGAPGAVWATLASNLSIYLLFPLLFRRGRWAVVFFLRALLPWK